VGDGFIGCIGMVLEMRVRFWFRVWRCMWGVILFDGIGCVGMALEARMASQGLKSWFRF
jgi:hypothetical protein